MLKVYIYQPYYYKENMIYSINYNKNAQVYWHINPIEGSWY